MFSNENLIYYFKLSLLIIGVGIVIYVLNIAENLGINILSLGGITLYVSGFYLLYKNGNIQKTIYWNFIKFSSGFVLISILMKILHLRFANEIMMLSFMIIGLIYFIYFLRKKNKLILDYFKVSWILMFLTSSLFLVFHWKYGDEIQVISTILFIASVFALIISKNRVKA